MIKEPQHCKSNHWLVSLRITEKDTEKAEQVREELLEKAHMEGLLLRPIWKPINELPMYNNSPASSLTESLYQSRRIVNLPSSPQIEKSF